MCMFAGAEPRVDRTRIFGRMKDRVATLVYSMRLSTPSDVAMILPVPIVPGSGADALRFTSLEAYPTFFDDLSAPFRPALMSYEPPIAVQRVGAYEASFLPRLQDFARVDPRFRLADDVWLALSDYEDYGFAVFRLAPGQDEHVHPMAFEYDTRFIDRIFFPTVHVHDGVVHETAAFDHEIFYQVETRRTNLSGEEMSDGYSRGPEPGVASQFVDCERAKGLVVPDRRVFRTTLEGELPNRDFFVVTTARSSSELYVH